MDLGWIGLTNSLLDGRVCNAKGWRDYYQMAEPKGGFLRVNKGGETVTGYLLKLAPRGKDKGAE